MNMAERELRGIIRDASPLRAVNDGFVNKLMEWHGKRHPSPKRMPEVAAGDVAFDYAEAFSSNIGLFTLEEQEILRRSTVAIPGVGGVGGSYLLTLTRLGVGHFAIADPDSFDLNNSNRQAGATTQTMGRLKVDVMAEMARSINPEVSIRTFSEPIGFGNIDSFLNGSNVVLDGIDFFQIGARRLLFQRARERGLFVITAGALGFGAATLTFSPEGPSLDEFMAIDDSMAPLEQLLRFAVGLAPAGLHIPYMDPSKVSLKSNKGPSSIIGVNSCAAVAATEVFNLLLKRQSPWCVPRYSHFDPYRRSYRKGTLRGGNRHPVQRLKLWYVKRLLRNVGGI